MATVLAEHFLPPANLCRSRQLSLRLVGHCVEELALVTEEILRKHLSLEKSKQHLEIGYFEAVSAPGFQPQKICIREDSPEALLI